MAIAEFGFARQPDALGRAFLRHFTMTYDGPSGSVILATPSSS